MTHRPRFAIPNVAGIEGGVKGKEQEPPREVMTLDLGYARIDLNRNFRQGIPEVVYGPGKTSSQLVEIVRGLLASQGAPILITRLDPSLWPELVSETGSGKFVESARLAVWRERDADPDMPLIAVVTAGTADQLVANEAEEVARAFGARVVRINDVGVAGIHRLLEKYADLDKCAIVIVVAGMEGALASVIGGLVEVPVVAVPSSAGYGAAFDGLAALLGMLTSCAAGLVVVNIDSGFGAAMAAFRIARMNMRIASRPRSTS
jgi:pyridinium-3,5-biscarboxylic acid mononucleotide synthase